MDRRMTCFCLVLTVAGTPRSSRAQEQNPATIPTELALALLDGGEYESGRRATRIFVGRAPDGIPQKLTSFEGGTVIGGARFAQNSVAVIAFTLPPNQVLLSADRELRARGLTSPPPPGGDRGGFVSNNYSSPWGNLYCADSAAISLGAAAAPNGGTYLKVSYTRNQQFSACTRRVRASFAEVEFKFPALLPPPGMLSRSSGSGMGGGSASASAVLTGPLKPADLLAHYRSQLDAAGWRTQAPVASGDDAALAYVEATDSTGAAWRGLMTALKSGPSEVEVEIRMRRPSIR